MRSFKRSTAWAIVLCLFFSLALSVGPMATKAKGATDSDPYVYYWHPAEEMVPEYYQRYAREYMLYSGHEICHKAMGENSSLPVRFFNVVNMDALIPDEADAPSGGYATVGAFCADAETYIVAGTSYRRLNLEDGYFNSDSNTLTGTVDARKIRAVLRNSMPNLADLSAFEEKINAYLTATYGQDAVLVSNLTGTQVTSATQAAIWHYANGFDFSAPYPYRKSDYFASWGAATIESARKNISYPDYPANFMDDATETTGTNINGVYQYLLSLPGETAKEIMITDKSVSLADAVISGDQGKITLLVDIKGTINADDVLNLTVQCGEQTKNFTLGAVKTLHAVDGLYPITLNDVSAEDCQNVKIVISGTQTVDDVCFFEAKPTEETDGRKTSQNLTGYGHEAAPVYSAAVIDVLAQAQALEITKVDEKTGNPLSGVTFDLYRKSDDGDLLMGSYITDESGKIAIHVTDADEFYFVETDTLSGYEAIDGKVTTGEVPNSWNAGRLEISKKLINTTPAQVGETFDFKLTLDLSTAPVMGNGLSWMTAHYISEQLECAKKLEWIASGDKKLTATFTLNADETVAIDSIPLGTAYTVEEILTEEDRAWFTVTAKVDDNSSQRSYTASGTLAQKNAVLFTNSVVTGPELKLGSLDISKKLINTTPAQVGETFNFKITVDFSTADVYVNGAPWMNDARLMEKVSSSEDLKWTKINGKYTANFTVDADETVTIEGLAQGTTYTVEEILTEEEREWFTVTSKVDDAGEKSGNTAQSFIAEKNGVLFTNTVVTGPELKLSSLNLSKALINTTPAQVWETYDFRITLDFSTADVYTDGAPWMNDEYLMSFVSSTEDLIWNEKNGKYTATFTVDADETVTIEGLAQGATYTLEEIMTDEDRQWFDVTSKVGNEAMQASNLAEGSVGELNAVLFTNSVVTGQLKRGRLDFTKKLINTTPALVGDTFKFKITVDFTSADIYTQGIPWVTDAYLLDFINTTEVLEWTEADGKFSAIFAVKADETITFNGLACGASYTIEEVLSEEEQKWFENDAQIGDTSVGSVAKSTVASQNTVVFTNSVITGPALVTGSVDVSKKLVNTTPAQVGETFRFQISLDLSTADVYVGAAPWMNDEYLMGFVTGTENLTWTQQDGKYIADFTVDADETFSISGIAQGTTYTVRELLTEEDREWFTTTSQIGEEEPQASDAVESTVAEKNAVTFTNTVVTGMALGTGRLNVGKELENANEAQADKAFTFRITLDLSLADIYQDPAPWMFDGYLLEQIQGNQELTWTQTGEKTYCATFQLKAGEAIAIDGLALGTGYTVEEVFSAADRNNYRVTTSQSANGQEAAKTESSLVKGQIADENDVIFLNRYVEKIPVTEDLSVTTPLLLCLLSVLTAAALLLNKRRLVG